MKSNRQRNTAQSVVSNSRFAKTTSNERSGSAEKRLILQVYPRFTLSGEAKGNSGQAAYPIILRISSEATVSHVVEQFLAKYVKEEKEKFLADHQQKGPGDGEGADATSRYQALVEKVWYEKKLPSLFPHSTYYEDYGLRVSDGAGNPLPIPRQPSGSGGAEGSDGSVTMVNHPVLRPQDKLLQASSHLTFPYMVCLTYEGGALSVAEAVASRERSVGGGEPPDEQPTTASPSPTHQSKVHPAMPLCAPNAMQGLSTGADRGDMSTAGTLQLLRGEIPTQSVPKTTFTFLLAPTADTASTVEGDGDRDGAAENMSETAHSLGTATLGLSGDEIGHSQEKHADPEEEGQSNEDDEEVGEGDDMRPDAIRAALGLSHYDIAMYGYGHSSASSKAVCRQQSLQDSKNFILAKREASIKEVEKRRLIRAGEREADANNKQLSMREEWMKEKKREEDLAKRTAFDMAKEKDHREREKLRRELDMAEALENHKKQVEKEEQAAAIRQQSLTQGVEHSLISKATARDRKIQAVVHASATIERESHKLGPMMGRLNETRPMLSRMDERVRQAQLLDSLVGKLDRTVADDSEQYSKEVAIAMEGRKEVKQEEDGAEMVREAEHMKRIRAQEVKAKSNNRKRALLSNADAEKKYNQSMIVQFAKNRLAEESGVVATPHVVDPSESTKLLGKPDHVSGIASSAVLNQVPTQFSPTPMSTHRHNQTSTPSQDALKDEETQRRYLQWRAERTAQAEADVARKEICAHRSKTRDGMIRPASWVNQRLTTDQTPTTLEAVLKQQ